MCSGKSTVAAQFGKLGCAVIDADEFAHQLLEDKPVKEKVISLLGEDILDSAGRIDHARVAQQVFADGQKLASLNEIIHPPVLARAEQLIGQYNRDNRIKAIVLDMPLLLEIGWDKRCDKLIFVECDEKIRAERAKKTGLYYENQLKVRENFQISLDNKRTLADNTLNGSSDLMELSRQVAKIFTKIVDSE